MRCAVGLLIFVTVLSGQASDLGAGEREGKPTASSTGNMGTQPGSATPATASSNAPVNQLIPWLLNEDRELRGIPFSQVIFDATGKRVLAIDPQNEADRRVVKQISAACDETMKRLNAQWREISV
jgi:hypothetical protein